MYLEVNVPVHTPDLVHKELFIATNPSMTARDLPLVLLMLTNLVLVLDFTVDHHHLDSFQVFPMLERILPRLEQTLGLVVYLEVNAVVHIPDLAPKGLFTATNRFMTAQGLQLVLLMLINLALVLDFMENHHLDNFQVVNRQAVVILITLNFKRRVSVLEFLDSVGQADQVLHNVQM